MGSDHKKEGQDIVDAKEKNKISFVCRQYNPILSWGRKPQEIHQKIIRAKKKMQQIHITQDQYTIIDCIPLAKNYKKEENSTHNIIRKNNMLRNKCNREVHDFVY